MQNDLDSQWENQSEQTKQASEPDSDMTLIVALQDWEVRITVMNILMVLMEKVHNM